jgi:molybdenum transport protein
MVPSLFVLSDVDLRRMLDEDAPYGDLTTHLLGVSGRPARISFVPRQPGVAAGTEEAARLLELCGASVIHVVASGTAMAAGEELLAASGLAGALHLGWKPAQTMLEYAMAIATRTRAMVEAARLGDDRAVVAATRKTIPGTRAMALKAVLAGGGVPHRTGLSDSVLVFAQHRALLGEDVVPAMVELARRQPERLLTIEVDSVAEAAKLLGPLAEAGALPGVVQLDKGGPRGVADLRQLITDLSRSGGPGAAGRTRTVIAAAGGVTVDNATEYARAGADVLVTSAPYHAPPLDVTVRITPAS